MEVNQTQILNRINLTKSSNRVIHPTSSSNSINLMKQNENISGRNIQNLTIRFYPSVEPSNKNNMKKIEKIQRIYYNKIVKYFTHFSLEKNEYRMKNRIEISKRNLQNLLKQRYQQIKEQIYQNVEKYEEELFNDTVPEPGELFPDRAIVPDVKILLSIKRYLEDFEPLRRHIDILLNRVIHILVLLKTEKDNENEKEYFKKNVYSSNKSLNNFPEDYLLYKLTNRRIDIDNYQEITKVYYEDEEEPFNFGVNSTFQEKSNIIFKFLDTGYQ
jgi:hypothetical protein